ncbi:MAG TPA: NAD(P)H-hydrate epimerase, partial [Parasegetibacter sp.]
MQLFSAEQLKEWDDYTIRNTPISSLDLMEKASAACFNWIKLNGFLHKPAYVFCGKGNNGGDGLAIARMISRENQPVVVFIIETGSGGTPAFQANLERLRQTEAEIHFIRSARQLPVISADAYIIDALFGTGLNRPLEGVYREITEFINRSDRPVISIDLPSGMMISSSSKGCPVVKARVTLTVQSVKLPFLFRENQEYVGQIVVLDCGLHPDYPEKTPTQLELIESEWIDQLIKPRRPFAHKGDYGHAALFAGSPGMAGAAILAARACMRSGVGKLT